MRHLLKQIKDKQKSERVLYRVCHNSWVYNGKITGSFTNSFGFFEYIRRLIFVAHADLYYTRADVLLRYKYKDYAYIPSNEAEPIEKAKLMHILSDGIDCFYDENFGLILRIDMKCSMSASRIFVQVETLNDGYIRFSDKKKNKTEGEIFEEFYWSNDDIAPYSKTVNEMATRFSADFDGRNVYLTAKTKNFNKALYSFFNMATLFTEFGRSINLPKIRKSVKK